MSKNHLTDLEKIEQAILRGLRKANWNRLEKRGSGETVAPAEGETGSCPKALPMLTDSPPELCDAALADGGQA